MQSKLNPLLNFQEEEKCPPCTSHTVRLIHNVTAPKGPKTSSLFILRCFFTALEAQGDSAQWGLISFGSADNHSTTEEKLEDNNMTSHVCGFCSSKITLQILRDRSLKDALLSLPCDSAPVILSKIQNIWYLLLLFFFSRGPCS